MDKLDMKKAILAAKAERGLTWEALAEEIGMSPVWTCSACLGENSMPSEQADKLVNKLGLGPEVAAALSAYPYKGGSMPREIPTDPLVYRFYEILLVYGGTLKEIIHEKFGDGIMMRHRLHHGHRQGRGPEGRPRQGHPERQVPALQEMVETGSGWVAITAGRTPTACA